MRKHGLHRARPEADRTGRDHQRAAGAIDPEDRGMIEPDRQAADWLPADEQDAREAVHTDRDPRDDIRQADEPRQQREGQDSTPRP